MACRIGFFRNFRFMFIAALVMGCQESNTSPIVSTDAQAKRLSLEGHRKTDASRVKIHRSPGSQAVGESYKDSVFQVPLDSSPSFGPDDAKVTAVLFGDLAQQSTESVLELLRRTTEQNRSFRWVFKFYPRGGIGGPAMMVSVAASYANEVGKFEEFVDEVFAGKEKISRKTIVAMASKVGIDKDHLLAALDDESRKKDIMADRRLAARLAVKRAPGLFLNGRPLRLTTSEKMKAVFLAAVARETSRAGMLADKGIAGVELYQKLTEHGRHSAWLKDGAMIQASRVLSKSRGYYSKDSTERTFFVEQGSGPHLGPEHPAVKIIVFVSATCSFCSGMLITLKKIANKYPRELGIWIKQLPDRKGRPGPMAAALFLQALSPNRKYWDLAPEILSGKIELDPDSLMRRAAKSGLDTGDLKRRLSHPEELEKQLAENRADAERLDIHSSPFLFVNGKPIMGATGFKTLEKTFLDELKKAKSTSAQ